jgi:hypothetical protein
MAGSKFSWTHGQVEYLFLINGAIYFSLDRFCERTASAQLHTVGKSFRFLLPSHVMLPVLGIGMAALEQKRLGEARLFEWMLPAIAFAFVFGSIPRQMKNFFISGLVFFAVGVYRLQQNVFPDQAIWPVTLLATGLLLMIAATNYAVIRVGLRRLRRSIG